MNKENENTIISADDLVFILKELKKEPVVITLHDLAIKLAYRKNASQLNQEVKVYDHNCVYEVGDLIYREYDDQLLTSSKGKEHFTGAVVLKVIKKMVYDSFNCEMLEVDFTGGGVFRKHIDYMKKSKTQVLLPSASEGNCEPPVVLKKDQDPRMHELPMTEKDLRVLQKNLGTALSRSKEFFKWKNSYQLTENRIPILDSLVKKIEAGIQKTGKSAGTADLAKEFLGTSVTKKDFDLHCISLNATLDKKFKKTFIYISPEKKGKWFLKEILDSRIKDLPLAKTLAKLPASNLPSDSDLTSGSQGFPLKVYLTWREVLSGGLTVPKAAVRELSESREYTMKDAESGDTYSTFFYPTRGIFLGLNDFYEKHTVTQGASLTLEKSEDYTITFALKRAKKGLTVPYVAYDAKKDRFSLSKKEKPTTSLPNKIIFLENHTLEKLETLYDERANLDLSELLILIFKNFGLEGEALSLHMQRAFHLVDMLRHTTLTDVEKSLCSTPEFIRSEKKKGLFLYKEHIEPEEEESLEELVEGKRPMPTAAAAASRGDEGLPAIGTVGEIETPTVILEEKITVIPEPPIPAPVKAPVEARRQVAARPKARPAPATAPTPPADPEKAQKDEKSKKKKHKAKAQVETDKAPRRRKGERRIIEERIELEESEQEALFAVKSEEVSDEDTLQFGAQPEDTEVEYKPKEVEKPMKGVFGDILKSALSQTQQEKTVIKAEVTKKAKSKAKKAKKDTKDKE
jgi:hypothetical protein